MASSMHLASQMSVEGLHGVELTFGVTKKAEAHVGQTVRPRLRGVMQSGPTSESGRVVRCQEGRDGVYAKSSLCSASR